MPWRAVVGLLAPASHAAMAGRRGDGDGDGRSRSSLRGSVPSAVADRDSAVAESDSAVAEVATAEDATPNAK